jgi:acyl carrier protein
MMDKIVFLQKLDEVMSLPKGTIKGDESLESLSGWDSVALMSFIALLDEELTIRVTGKQVVQCKTVSDLVALAGEKVA